MPSRTILKSSQIVAYIWTLCGSEPP